MNAKHTPKNIHLTGMKHAKETVCALLNNQAELVEALEELLSDIEAGTKRLDFANGKKKARVALSRASGEKS